MYIIVSVFSLAAFSEVRPKVLLSNTKEPIKISGLDLFVQGKTKKEWSGKKTLVYKCKKKSSFEVGSRTGLLKFENRTFRGKLLVYSRPPRCLVVNRPLIEKYLRSLLNKEMNSSWPIEALKAQAVAARSYAYVKYLRRKKRLYHLINSEKDQVSGGIFDETAKTIEAVNQTKGEILRVENKKLGLIYYHSHCGGKTLLPGDVWGNRTSSNYTTISCPYCHKNTLRWKAFISEKMWKKKYSHNPYRIRQIFGRRKIRSNNFDIFKSDGGRLIKGRGHGHGVGMCQYGAKNMALGGASYKDILKFYYPNHKITLIKEKL